MVHDGAHDQYECVFIERAVPRVGQRLPAGSTATITVTSVRSATWNLAVDGDIFPAPLSLAEQEELNSTLLLRYKLLLIKIRKIQHSG